MVKGDKVKKYKLIVEEVNLHYYLVEARDTQQAINRYDDGDYIKIGTKPKQEDIVTIKEYFDE